MPKKPEARRQSNLHVLRQLKLHCGLLACHGLLRSDINIADLLPDHHITYAIYGLEGLDTRLAGVLGTAWAVCGLFDHCHLGLAIRV